ncbi:tol-pal system-associated acyl-CoA thioesterase [Roseateles oligotrophus]|uniref:Tol-pal system-associated acyl-CoA thioesterase n=1 Tax=Roseateles oligotrophus TaxID=1769250 RepID=A0ABT2YFI0_9BURK|nr:tol-pal system-associated acyl-CoA thioesterase [Roseateles oligotrophus]MCV2368810.1 tol-pal system-associated acyl-CoA thioesterase [Roseateles oligotrophus]
MTTVFKREMRIYWEDTDAGGVVFYANYLKFFERARTEWLRELGFSQELMRLQDGVMFVVGSTQTRYLRPARLDDLLQVSVELREMGRASMLLFQQAFCGERLLAEGEIRIACVKSQSGSAQHSDLLPTRMPAALTRALEPLNP